MQIAKIARFARAGNIDALKAIPEGAEFDRVRVMSRGFYNLVWPLVRLMGAEDAHALAIRALQWGLIPTPIADDPPELGQTLWGRHFPNPIGLAAGFDKNAEVHQQMLAQGFGFVEVGSVTPKAQPGNPKPRLFRLESDRGVINRMGFNNDGMDAVAARLKGRAQVSSGGGIVGVNLGKNKTTEDAAADYELGVRKFAALADFLVINISSPNTPGLRALQGPEPLRELLGRTRKALADSNGHDARPPLLLKIAPDLTDEDKADIAAEVLNAGIDGLIVTNTTTQRPDGLSDPNSQEAGGLSGRPLLEMSTRVLGEMYAATDGKIPLIGVGGIEDGRGAFDKILAGASLVEFYSAMVYEGPGLVRTIKRELAEILKAEGFANVADAVGKG